MNEAPLWSAMNRILFTAALTSLFSMTALCNPASPGPSGIEGVILVSPSHGGPIRKDRPSATPAGNVEFIVKKGDAQVSSFTTDNEGRFKISLEPGHYVVMREDPGARVGHWRFEADVAANQITGVQWTADSGMR